jgi:ketosteroid isomerase-like protein
MSEENVEIVRQMLSAFHGGDADGALAYFDAEVVTDMSRRLGGGIGRGREELRQIITEWVGTFEGWSEEIEEIRDLGNFVHVVATQRGIGKGSGVEVETTYHVLYEVRGASIIRVTAYATRAEALEAAGLSG